MKDYVDIASKFILNKRGLIEDKQLSPTEIKKFLDIAAENMRFAKKEVIPYDKQLGKSMYNDAEALWKSMNNLMNQRRGIKEDLYTEAKAKTPITFWITYKKGSGSSKPIPLDIYMDKARAERAVKNDPDPDLAVEKIDVTLERI